VLRITCEKCSRSGQYRLDRLIMRYGIDAKLFDWFDEDTADCRRKQAKTRMTSAAHGARICRRWCKFRNGRIGLLFPK